MMGEQEMVPVGAQAGAEEEAGGWPGQAPDPQQGPRDLPAEAGPANTAGDAGDAEETEECGGEPAAAARRRTGWGHARQGWTDRARGERDRRDTKDQGPSGWTRRNGKWSRVRPAQSRRGAGSRALGKSNSGSNRGRNNGPIGDAGADRLPPGTGGRHAS